MSLLFVLLSLLLLHLCCHYERAALSTCSSHDHRTPMTAAVLLPVAHAFVTPHHRHHYHHHHHHHLKCRHRRHNLFADSNTNGNDDGNNDGNNDQDFMASLQNRIQKSKNMETKLPLIVLDSMLPRQKLILTVQNQLLLNLIASRVRNETPTLGMIGMAKLQSGSMVHLTKGVEVEITIVNDDNDNDNDDDDDDDDESKTGSELLGTVVEFKAGRRFRLDGDVIHTDEGWTEGKVAFLSSKEEEDYEISQNIGSQNPVSSIANAITKAKELCSPNLNLPDNMTLIDRWIQLAKQNEKSPGQINTLIEELGNVPDENEPSEIAFWIGSLINPLPAMGVAMEIRPALLMAESAEERIQIAYDGLLRSIKHMDGSARMW